jgi:hypothetical protein
MTRAAPERAIQIAIKRRLALSGVVCHHSPNAGKRSVIGGRMLKAEGMITGWPDLTLVGPDKRIAFLEVKAEKGRTSAAQDECLAMLRRILFPELDRIPVKPEAFGLAHAVFGVEDDAIACGFSDHVGGDFTHGRAEIACDVEGGGLAARFQEVDGCGNLAQSHPAFRGGARGIDSGGRKAPTQCEGGFHSIAHHGVREDKWDQCRDSWTSDSE